MVVRTISHRKIVAAVNKVVGERKEIEKLSVQLGLTTKSCVRLKALKTKTEASSYGEVVRNALQLYEALIEETEKGNKLFLQDKSGYSSVFRLWL